MLRTKDFRNKRISDKSRDLSLKSLNLKIFRAEREVTAKDCLATVYLKHRSLQNRKVKYRG